MRTIDLNGTWQLRWYDSQRGDSAERVAKGEAGLERAWPAQVPGSVHETLISSGLIPEPTHGLNILSARWVEETIWHYRRTFELPALANDERAILVCDELDLAATVLMNGQPIGTHANFYRPASFDCTGALLPGENTIVIRIESGLFHTANLDASPYEALAAMHLTKKPWLRKPAFSHGWDWSPRLMNVGVTGGVRLLIFREVHCLASSMRTEVSDDLSTGSVQARAWIEVMTPCIVDAELLLPEIGFIVKRTWELAVGEHRLDLGGEIAQPPLWWPRGHGGQRLIEATLKIYCADTPLLTKSRRLGFRHVRMRQDPHPEGGKDFVLEVNGQPIFCKGANFVPADIVLSRVGRDRYSALLALAAEAHFNFLRVWGGGLYESADFYELCDEHGILVWQDFAFACNRYPGHLPEFRDEIRREAQHQVRRLASHPSLVVWCGNNECELGAWEWWTGRGHQMPDHGLFHDLLPRVLKAEDPGRFYWPASPFSPDHEPPNDDLSGDQHPWKVGFFDCDFRQYRDMKCRFPNEGGLLGPTSLPTVLDCLPEGMRQPGSFAWELHDNSIAYWGDSIPPPDAFLHQWMGDRLENLSVEDYVFRAGLLQGLGLAEFIRSFRSRMFDSAAAVFWMFNDAWPCTRSWSIVDYHLRRTPSFWPVRRAFSPLAVFTTIRERRVRIIVVNDGPSQMVRVRFGIHRLQGGYPMDENVEVSARGQTVTVVGEFGVAGWEAMGFTSHVVFAELFDAGTAPDPLSMDTLILPLYREMEWPVANVKVWHHRDRLVISSDLFVWRMCLDLGGGITLDDNFFDVLPGRSRTVSWPSDRPLPTLRTGSPTNIHHEQTPE